MIESVSVFIFLQLSHTKQFSTVIEHFWEYFFSKIKASPFDPNNMSMRYIFLSVLLPILLLACAPPTEPSFSEESDKEKVMEILKNLDNYTLDIEDKISVYSEDVIHMGQGNRPITNLEDLKAMLLEESMWGHSEMKHEAYEIHSYMDHVIMRGGVTGTWHSMDGKTKIPFETNNLITFKRTPSGELKVWHVIFNRVEN